MQAPILVMLCIQDRPRHGYSLSVAMEFLTVTHGFSAIGNATHRIFGYLDPSSVRNGAAGKPSLL